jgi:hypothetical protein
MDLIRIAGVVESAAVLIGKGGAPEPGYYVLV